MKHVVWSQWDDLVVPNGFTLRSPANTDLATANLDDITFYIPSYMGGRKALDRKSTRLNSSHVSESRMPSSA